jgi:integrase
LGYGCDGLESGDHLGALAASQCTDHCRLAVTLNGQAHQQVAYWRKHLGRKLRRADANAYREIVGMHHDLQHAGEQEIASMQGPALPGNQNEIVRGTPLDAHNVRRDFRKVADAAGLAAGEWTPRELRHSFVSLLSDDGMPIEHIARLVGHTSTAVTETVYWHQIRPVIVLGAEAMDRIFREALSAKLS